MGKLSHYESCSNCGSKNNKAVYVDEAGEVESKYCFTPGCTFRHKVEAINWPIGVHWEIEERKLTKATCVKYDVRQEGMTHLFPYYHEGKVVAYEQRNLLFKKRAPGYFSTKGSTMKYFFGMQAVHTKNILAIAFGTYDAMSVYQATGIPCLSTSDSRLKACIQHNYQWLLSFGKIVFLPDKDEACMKALSDVEDMLPRSTTYISTLSFKDPNEYLVKGMESLLKQAFYSALPMAGNLFVQNPSQFVSLDNTPGIGVLSGTYIDKFLQGFRAGEVTIVMGSPTVGKTTYSRHLLANFMRSRVNVALLTSEEGPKKFLGKLANHVVQRMRTQEDIPLLSELFDQRMQVYAKDEYTFDDIEAFVVTAVRAFDTKVVLIDNVSAIADAASLNADISKYVKMFNRLAAKLECHIIVISHTSRSVGAEDTLDETALMQLGFGSSALEKFGWNIVLVARKPSDPVAMIHVLKNREVGVKGIGKFLAAFDEAMWTIVESGLESMKETVDAKVSMC